MRGSPRVSIGSPVFNGERFLAETLDSSPSFMQRRGSELLFRLSKEPRRLWRRYLLLNPYYLSLLLWQKIGLGQFDPDNAVRPTEELLYG